MIICCPLPPSIQGIRLPPRTIFSLQQHLCFPILSLRPKSTIRISCGVGLLLKALPLSLHMVGSLLSIRWNTRCGAGMLDACIVPPNDGFGTSSFETAMDATMF